MRIQRNMLGLWDSLVCICFRPNLLGCVLEQQTLEAAATPGSPLGWTAPVKWHSTGTSLALPQQIADTPSPVQSQDRSVERSCWCKGLCVPPGSAATGFIAQSWSLWHSQCVTGFCSWGTVGIHVCDWVGSCVELGIQARYGSDAAF